jgi:hypothetical protein
MSMGAGMVRGTGVAAVVGVVVLVCAVAGASASAGKSPTPVRKLAPCTLQAGSDTTLGPRPSGLIAYLDGATDGLTTASGATGATGPFSERVFKDYRISGVDLAIGWDILQPTDGPIDWAPLDCTFAQADAHQKFVVLTLLPGWHTPAWALATTTSTTPAADPITACPGSVTATPFAWTYDGSDPPAKTVPDPWNSVYLCRWFNFLKAVEARYGGNPEFRMISVAGPTSISDEMTLPRNPGSPPPGSDLCAVTHPVLVKIDPPCDTAVPPVAKSANGTPVDTYGSDINMWRALGYTPAAYTGAWATAFRHYRAMFTNQYLSLALGDGLPIGSQPSTGAPSVSDPSQTTATPLTVIRTGLGYASRFVLQEDALSGAGASQRRPYAYVQANCADANTGFQTEAPSQPGVSPSALAAALQKGVAAGGRFIEVYQQDVLDTAGSSGHDVQAALNYAYQALQNPVTCAPLTITATPQTATIGTAITITVNSTLSPDELDYNEGVPPTVPATAAIDIYVGSSTSPAITCTTWPCTKTLGSTPGGTTTVTAELAYPPGPGDPPQAPIATAKTSVARTGAGGSGKPCTTTVCNKT